MFSRYLCSSTRRTLALLLLAVSYWTASAYREPPLEALPAREEDYGLRDYIEAADEREAAKPFVLRNEQEFLQQQQQKPHIRRKRSVPPVDINALTASLAQVGNTPIFAPNGGALFALTINMFGIGAANADAYAEMFTVDPSNNVTQFHICDVKTTKIGSGLTTPGNTINITKYTNVLNPSYVDRVRIDLAGVYATSPSTACTSFCNVTFVIAVKLVNSTTGSFNVSAGVAYINSTYMLIGQLPVTVATGTPNITTDYSFALAGNLTGPATIEQGDVGMFSVNTSLNLPRTTIMFSVYTGDQIEDKFSIGNIRVNRTGFCFSCYRNISGDNSSAYISPSSTGVTVYNYNLTTVDLLNFGADAFIDPEDSIYYEFGIYVPPTTPADTNLTIAAEVILDNAIIWTGILYVVVKPFVTQTLGTVTSVTGAAVTSTSITQLGSASFQVNVTLPAGYVNVPLTAVGDSGLFPCNIRIVKQGFNIHYLTPVFLTKTVSADNQTVSVDFGRVVVRTESILPEDSQFVLEISFRAPSSATTGSHSFTVTVGGATYSNSVTVTGPATTAAPTAALTSPWGSSLYVGATSLADLKLTLAGGQAAQDLSIEFFGDSAQTTTDIRVCRAEFSFVGNGVPCLQPYVANSSNLTTYTVNYQYAPWFTNHSYLRAGDVCPASSRSVNVANATTDYIVIANVAFYLGAQSTVTSGTYNLQAKVTANGAASTVTLPYTIATTGFPTTILPYVNIGNMLFSGVMLNQTAPSGSLMTGQVGLIPIFLKFAPQSRQKYTISLNLDTPNMVICKVDLIFVGHGFGCVDSNFPIKRGFGYVNTFDYPNRTSAFLNFGIITDTSTEPFVQDTRADSNAIVLGVYVKGAATGSSVLSFSHMGTSEGSVTYNISSSTPAAVTAAPMLTGPFDVFTMNAASPVVIAPGYISVIGYNVTYPGAATGNMTVKVAPSAGSASSLEIVSVQVTMVGRNYPCLNASAVAVGTLVNSTLTASAGFYSEYNIQFDVCKYPFSNKVEDDQFRLEIALRSIPGSTVTSLSADITIAGASEITSTSATASLSATGTAPPVPAAGTIAFAPLTSIPPTINVGTLGWIPFGIKILPGLTADMTLVVTTPFGASDRALMTITGARINRTLTGVNVVGVGDIVETNVLYSGSALFPQQISNATINLMNVTNTGFTFRQPNYNVEDDILWVDVEVLMTDEAANVAGVNITATADLLVAGTKVNSVAGQSVAVVGRAATRQTESADISVTMWLTDNTTTTFAPLSEINLSMLVKHLPTSLAEGLSTTIRVFFPPFISFVSGTNVVATNKSYSADATTTTADSYLDITFTEFLFADIVSINFTLSVDPNGSRPPGSPDVPASLVARVICAQEPFSSWPVSISTMLYCGNVATLSVVVQGSGCWSPLGMGQSATPVVTDCQITASSALDNNHMPSMARLGGTSMWTPAVRSGLLWAQPYLQVDFEAAVIVAGFVDEVITGQRSIENFRVDYSYDGVNFVQGENGTLSASNRTYVLNSRLQVRAVRLVVISSTGSSQYLGVRMEWYGCRLPNGTTLAGTLTVPPIMGTCTADLMTPISSSSRDWRHFVVDDSTNFVYVCDTNSEDNIMKCWVTPDGSLWKVAPAYVNYVAGYDSSKKRIVGQDFQQRTWLATRDGTLWTVLPDAEASATVNATTFKRSKVVPGKSATDLSSLSLTDGLWTADYVGLKKSSSSTYSLKWDNCCPTK